MARALRHLVLFVLAPFTAMAQSGYTDDMYQRGLTNQSTAPLFVLVTLADPETGVDRTACVDAPFLLGAIHIEYHLSYDEPGVSKALAIAAAQPGRRFTFKNRKARANIPVEYSTELAASIRESLKDKSDAQLRKGLETYNGELHLLYRSKSTDSADRGVLHAVCQALLERGILVGHTDWGYQLYLEE